MGRYYALADGEAASVADAIRDHYSPLGPGDRVPTAPASVAVALAEKLDTLAGFFAIGEKPTGSKDPFALRRAGLGIIRIILENELRLDLSRLFGYAVHAAGKMTTDETSAEIIAFLIDRLKVYLRERGISHDLINAVAARGDLGDLVLTLRRIEALAGFVKSEDGANLLAAYRRAANILRIEEKKDGKTYDTAVDPDLFALDEERALYAAFEAAAPRVDSLLNAEDFVGAMSVLSGVRAAVDAFFERVTVNADDPAVRRNRLALLSVLRNAPDKLADFSKIEAG